MNKRFQERAVKALVSALKTNRVSRHHVKSVLRYKNVDVTEVEEFLDSENDIIRRFAIEVVGAKGCVDKLVKMVKDEEDSGIIRCILTALSNRKLSPDELMDLLDSENPLIKEAAIQMYRKAGKADRLLGLMLSAEDVKMEERLMKYIEDEDEKKTGG